MEEINISNLLLFSLDLFAFIFASVYIENVGKNEKKNIRMKNEGWNSEKNNHLAALLELEVKKRAREGVFRYQRYFYRLDRRNKTIIYLKFDKHCQ